MPMPFIGQLTSPDGKTLYVTASDSEGLRYCAHTADEAERFESRELAEQAARDIKQIQLVRDYPHAIVEV